MYIGIQKHSRTVLTVLRNFPYIYMFISVYLHEVLENGHMHSTQVFPSRNMRYASSNNNEMTDSHELILPTE